jgi:hypothetical protein
MLLQVKLSFQNLLQTEELKTMVIATAAMDILFIIDKLKKNHKHVRAA